jgi:predicted dehydrogenase
MEVALMKLAMIGTGDIAGYHAQGIRDHEHASLVALANWREDSLGRLAARFAVPSTTTRWQDIAEDPDIDGVVVATPNALHAEQAVACLRAGKHVLVEKPMATSTSEAEEMVAAARSSDRWLMVAHCFRFHPDVQRMRARIAGGEFGTVVRTRSYGVHAGSGPSGWFTDRRLAGGGALIDMGVHAIDTTRYLLGGPLPTRVCAVVGTRYGSYDVDDDGVILITWSNGASSVVDFGWWQPHLGGLLGDNEIYGTKGYARIWPFTETPTGYDHWPQSMYSAQIAEFVNSIEAGRRPSPGGEDGLIVMQIVEAAYRSGVAAAAGGEPK